MPVTAQRTNLAAVRNGDTPVLTFETTPRTAGILVRQIKIDGGTQMRAALDQATVIEYQELLDANPGQWPFPPIVVFYDGETHWLGDGFHRVAAASTRRTVIPADLRDGTRRDAILYAAGANANHGLRRTGADKRRAVEVLLRDEEWGQWSNTEIARRCQVSEGTVRTLRGLLERTSQITKSITRKAADGRTMDTRAIGARSLAVAPGAGSNGVAGITVNGDRPLPNWVGAEEPANTGSVASAATGSRQQGSPLAKCSVCSRPLYDPVQAAQGIGACCAAKKAAGMVAGDDGTEAEPQAESATWSTGAGLDSRTLVVRGQLNVFRAALDSLDAWAEATGHFTATLEAERGLRRVIELTEQELHALGAA